MANTTVIKAPVSRRDERFEKAVTHVLFGGALIQASALFYYIAYFSTEGSLPAPFIYNKFDTFMDLYNTLWWGYSPDKYTIWKSVYPPINFLVLDLARFLIYGAFSPAEPLEARAETLIPASIIVALHVIGPFFLATSAYWRQLSPRNKLLTAVFCVTSAPFLFSMERGNLIIIAIFFMPMVFSRNDILKAIGIAVVINIKPYFAAILIGLTIARKWKLLISGVCIAGSIFLFSGLLSDPNFLWFIPNLLSFSQNETILSGREVIAFPSSVSALTFVINLGLKNSIDPNAAIGLLALTAILIESIKWTCLTYLCLSLFISRDKILVNEFIVTMIVIVINIGIWAGGYSQIFLMACIPVLFCMRYRVAYAIILFVIFLPLDCVTIFSEALGLVFSFVSNSIVDLTWQLGLGSVVRPVINLVLAVGLGTEFMIRTAADRQVPALRLRGIRV